MPLEILAVLVVLGVGGVVLAIHLTGGTITAELASPEVAKARFAEDFPDAVVEKVIITKDRRSAILSLDGGGCGIIHAVGDRFLTRYHGADDNLITETVGDATLSLRFDDIGWRGGDFIFSSDKDRDNALLILVGAEIGGSRNG